jgi:hypothetical protein
MQRSLRIARARRLTVQSLIAYAIALVFAAHAAHAESGGDGSRTMQSVDQQVQDIKSDVLEIAAELRGLEEKPETGRLYLDRSLIVISVLTGGTDVGAI